MKCPKCGFNDIKETDTICRGCGESVFNIKNNKVVIDKSNKETNNKIYKQPIKANEQEEIEILSINDNIQEKNNQTPSVNEENPSKACKKCGNVINDGEDYCPNCKPSETEIKSNQKKGKINILLIIIFLLSTYICDIFLALMGIMISPIFVLIIDIIVISIYIYLKKHESKSEKVKSTSENYEVALEGVSIAATIISILGFCIILYMMIMFFKLIGSLGSIG